MGKKKGSARNKVRGNAISNRNGRRGNLGTSNGNSNGTATTTTTTTSAVTTAMITRIMEPSTMPTKNVKDKDIVLQRLRQRYGGTTENDIQTEIHRNKDSALAALPHHVYTGIHLYTKYKVFNMVVSTLIDFFADLPPEVEEQAISEQQQLQDIYTKYGLSDRDMHNYFQQAAWDAISYYLVSRSLLNPKPSNKTASSYIVDALTCVEKDTSVVTV
jgi:hypothetical protein